MPEKNFKFEILKFFIIPFLVMAIVILVLAHFSVNSQNNKIYNNMIEYSESLVDSYVRRINNSDNIKEIILDEIDDKMFLIANQVITDENNITNEYLDALVSEYDIDEINVYSPTSKLIYSNKRQLIGFQSYEGHNVYDFSISGEDKASYDIRVGEIDGLAELKLILKKSPSGKVIQVGISVERLNSFLETFSLKKLIDDYVDKESIANVFFVDQNYNLVVSGNDNLGGITFSEEDINKHFKSDKINLGKDLFGAKSIHVCAPVINNGERIGTMTVVWSSSMITKNIYDVIKESALRFLLIILILGSSMFYGYKKREEARKLNYFDQVTKLPNDFYLKIYLEKRIKNLKKNNLALMVIKINNLDTYNSSFGLEQGDILLRDIATLLSKYIREDDILFKFSGSKYVFLVNNYPHDNYMNEIANTILTDFNETSAITNKEEFLSLNISINLVESNKSANEILDDTFLGIELIEDETDKNYIVLANNLKDKKNRELKIENAIKEVINNADNNMFSLNFQPVYKLHSNEIGGLEALARMRLDDFGPISPLEFINIAEDKQLIHKLGLVILKEALSAMQRIDKIINKELIIGINISRLQLYRSDFIESVTEIIEELNFDWSRINFEITESTFVKNYSLIKTNIQKLKDKGSRIALDDFGTEFSTLSELRNLNIDYLKIDKSFIDNIGVVNQEHLITEDIIRIGEKLGLRVCAEGVETKEQLAYLKEHKCDLAQGYYLSRPLSEKDVTELLIEKIK